MQAASAADKAAAAVMAAAGDEAGEQAVSTPRALAAAASLPPLLEAAAAANPAAAAATAAAARPQTKALGVFGKVWDFMIDEAAYVEAAEGEQALLSVEWACVRAGVWRAGGRATFQVPALGGHSV